MQGQSEQRPHSGAGSGRLPAGGWPETPVWFEFPAPHSLHQPAAWLRAARSVPYLGLFSPPPPNQMALCGLKRQAWGAGGAQRRAVATAGSRAPAAVPLPLARPTHPSGCGENQAPRPRPARVAALRRGGGRVEHSPPCPSQAASLPLVFI